MSLNPEDLDRSLKSYKIEAIITNIENMDEAVKLQQEGILPDLAERSN